MKKGMENNRRIRSRPHLCLRCLLAIRPAFFRKQEENWLEHITEDTQGRCTGLCCLHEYKWRS